MLYQIGKILLVFSDAKRIPLFLLGIKHQVGQEALHLKLTGVISIIKGQFPNSFAMLPVKNEGFYAILSLMFGDMY